MPISGKAIDLILGMKLNDFFNSSKRAQAEYVKMKGSIEKNPIKIKESGTKLILQRITQLSGAYLVITRLIPDFIRASNVQEQANNRLATALKNAGDATEETYKKQREFSSWIQKVTTVGDEQAEMLQAMALNMQAPIDKTKEVVQNAIALSKAFELDMNVAIRAAVSALDDNYSMLTRYIPALRTANSEAEKAAIYQRTVADGWKTATEELKTGAGALEDFNNTIGDFKEVAGDLIKNILIPLVKTANPVIKALNDMDTGTRNAALGTTALLIVVPKLVIAIRGLYAAMGPAGWLILGVGAAATAMGIYAANTVEAAEATERFEASTSNVEERLKLLDKNLGDIGMKSIQELAVIQERLAFRMQQAQEKGNFTLYEGYKKHYDNVTKLIREKTDFIARNAPIRASASIFSPEDIENLQANLDQTFDRIEDFYFNFDEINTEFTDTIYEDLDNQFLYRTFLLESQLDQVKKYAGEESKEYEKLSRKKWAIELNYQKRKKQLELEGLESSLELAAQFFTAFQGQSRNLFILGKTAAIAQAIVNTYEGASKAVATYPPPFSYIMAAAQIALGYAQVDKIRATEFKGKARGGLISDSDVASFAFTPAGEDGILAAQIGEYVVNRAATRQYYPLLEQINKMGLKGYQQGGRVDQVQGGVLDLSGLNAAVQDAIIDGFDNSQLKVIGRININGNQIQIILDKTDALKTQIAES